MKETKRYYSAIAELIQGFFEQAEMLSPPNIPSSSKLIQQLKREQFFSKGVIYSQRLDCELDLEQAVFLLFDSDKTLTEMAELIAEAFPENGDCNQLHIVVFVETIEQSLLVERSKKIILNTIKQAIKQPRAKFDFCIQHIPTHTLIRSKVQIQTRIQAPEYPPEHPTVDIIPPSGHIHSIVYIAKLFDIVNIYNQIGSELFQRNVRYRIRDTMNVDSVIQQTLENAPNDFFNLNNGIAIQIRSCQFLDRKYADCIRLSYQNVGDLSVINGAQTIAAAGEYFFAPEFIKSKEDAEKIKRAKANAWVLLRVIYPDEQKDESTEKIFEQISISLNRQKPINSVDIEYTRPAVATINALYDKHKNDERYFKLLKRGESEEGISQHQLADFSRAVMAYYYNEPWTARSSSTQDIIRYDEDSESSAKTVYAPFVSDLDNNELFLQWYAPLNFAIRLSNLFAEAAREARKGSEITDAAQEAFLSYGRYFFTAHVINHLNPTASNERNELKSFLEFPYPVSVLKNAELEINKLIKGYSVLFSNYVKDVFSSSTKTSAFDSNNFKNKNLYCAWCEYSESSPNVGHWFQVMEKALGKGLT